MDLIWITIKSLSMINRCIKIKSNDYIMHNKHDLT